MTRICGAILVCCVFWGAGGCSPDSGGLVSRQEYLLGTICTLTIHQDAPEGLFAEAFGLVRDIERKMSVELEESDLSRVNRAAGIAPVAVSPETFQVVREGILFARRSEGAFDVTVGPLARLWGIGTARARVPGPEEIGAARALVGWRDVELEEEGHRIFLRRAGMRLDLGGIAKGYAADRVTALLRTRGVRSALIDLGGNIAVLGRPPGREKWRVGVQHPWAERGSFLGILAAADTSIVTSGDYERFFVRDGVRYHHVFDPATGQPVRNGVVSTTIVCASSITADALSTALFVLGPERGLALAGTFPGVEAMVVTKDRRLHATAGWALNFSLTDSSFRVP